MHHLAAFDVLLTEGFNRLARDLVAGMLDAVEAGLDHRMVKDEPPRDFARMLLELQSAATSTPPTGSSDRNEQWIKLDRPRPVYILYCTA